MVKKFLEKRCPFLFSKKTHLAFGVEESPNKYPLDKARYVLMASYIHEEYLKLKRPVRVLDIGCHEGMMILYCKQNKSEVEFYGMDILKERLDKALKRGYKSALLQDIRNRPFPYKDDFFDVVICSHILEHLKRPGRALAELNRVMKQGAALLVGVPIGVLPAILWRRHVTPLYDRTRKPEDCLKRFGHVSFFTLPKLKKLLKDYGFATENARGDYFIRSRRFFLEDHKWWFDFNQWYGRIFPGIMGHVTVKAHLRERKKRP